MGWAVDNDHDGSNATDVISTGIVRKRPRSEWSMFVYVRLSRMMLTTGAQQVRMSNKL